MTIAWHVINIHVVKHLDNFDSIELSLTTEKRYCTCNHLNHIRSTIHNKTASFFSLFKSVIEMFIAYISNILRMFSIIIDIYLVKYHFEYFKDV